MNQLHIVTVGISLLNHFTRAKNLTLQEALKRGQLVGQFLAENPKTNCAEINALDARVGLLGRPPKGLGVSLVYSQTLEGKLCARLIDKFLRARKVPVTRLQLESIDLPSRAQADPEVVQQLAEKGLSRLRTKVAEHIVKMKSQHGELDIQFNATGGYKAETAVLYELGRTLRIPVYYLHETYRVAITLP